jgi:hypothetical protein
MFFKDLFSFCEKKYQSFNPFSLIMEIQCTRTVPEAFHFTIFPFDRSACVYCSYTVYCSRNDHRLSFSLSFRTSVRKAYFHCENQMYMNMFVKVTENSPTIRNFISMLPMFRENAMKTSKQE